MQVWWNGVDQFKFSCVVKSPIVLPQSDGHFDCHSFVHILEVDKEIRACRLQVQMSERKKEIWQVGKQRTAKEDVVWGDDQQMLCCL